MRVLVVGSGGREHALIWKLAQSPQVTKLYCAPGNAGVETEAECPAIAATDIDTLLDFARTNAVDLTVIGPEAPLMGGIVDRFQSARLRVFGPTKRAAQIEGSKSFAKDFMQRHGIPTAAYQTFTDESAALKFLAAKQMPIVIKSDGLMAGKGVVVAHSRDEAEASVRRWLAAPGGRIVIEECLVGEEISLMAFVDGRVVRPMAAAQDHKPVFDNDRGPNTGGMGAYSPVPQIPLESLKTAVETILQPTADGLVSEGISFHGVLYGGLMMTDEGPKVIEFNARFGDPETQVILPRMQTDLLDVLLATVEHRLADISLEWSSEAATAVVAASPGYPGDYPKGSPIEGLDELPQGVLCFHAGTKWADGRLVTNGGRVLSVVGRASNPADAAARAYESLENIQFSGIHFRTDIGRKPF